MSKKPRFFCDHCGSEVGRDQSACPQCGRFFAAVRCPACGFSGEGGAFSGGCPSCGYSRPPPAESPPDSPAPGFKPPPGKLPLWVYFLTLAAFFGACALLFFTLSS